MTRATSDQVIIRSGRRMPQWTDVPDWITWAYTPKARELYRLLKMHVNARRSDTQVWPLQKDLAEMMHLSRGDKLGPYLRELSADLPGCAEGSGGAIEVDKTATVPSQAVYTVHDTPPPGYAGCMSLAQWYADRRRRRSGPPPSKPKPQVTPDTPSGGDVQPPADVTDGEPPCAPSRGYVDTPRGGYVDTPCTGHQLEEENRKKRTDPPTAPAAASGAPGSGGQVGDVDDEAARAVLARLLDGVAAGRLPTRVQADRLASTIGRALAAGWCRDDLVLRLGGFAGAEHVYGVLRYRLEQLPPLPSKVSTPAAAGGEVPQWVRERQERAGGISSRGQASRTHARRTAAAAASSRRTKVGP